MLVTMLPCGLVLSKKIGWPCASSCIFQASGMNRGSKHVCKRGPPSDATKEKQGCGLELSVLLQF